MKHSIVSKCALAVAVLVSLRPAVASAGIMSLYEFTNTTTDTVRGTPGNGTVVGTGSYAPGMIGDAFSFDGNTYIYAPQAGGDLSAFSISAWVKFNQFTVWGTILKNWGQTPGAFHLGLDAGSNQISNYIGTTEGTPLVISGNLSTNQWYNVAVTFGPSGYQKLYINGSLVD